MACTGHIRPQRPQPVHWAASMTALPSDMESAGQPLSVVLCHEGMSYDRLPGARTDLPPEVIEQVDLWARYRGYIERAERIVEKSARQTHVRIPADFDYMSLAMLRYEAREKLEKVRPTDLGMAARIPGVNPADIEILSVAIHRDKANVPRGTINDQLEKK